MFVRIKRAVTVEMWNNNGEPESELGEGYLKRMRPGVYPVDDIQEGDRKGCSVIDFLQYGCAEIPDDCWDFYEEGVCSVPIGAPMFSRN